MKEFFKRPLWSVRAGLLPQPKRLAKDPRTDSSGFFMRFMKPIPTTYEGVQFRSRLEARWAVFFDELKIFFHYEPFEFNRNGLSYTPDFVLHNFFFLDDLSIVEIKPKEPNAEYIEYLKRVRDPEKKDLFVFFGEPAFGVDNAIKITTRGPKEDRRQVVERGAIHVCPRCEWFKWYCSEDKFSYCQCECWMGKPSTNIEKAYHTANEYRFDL